MVVGLIKGCVCVCVHAKMKTAQIHKYNFHHYRFKHCSRRISFGLPWKTCTPHTDRKRGLVTQTQIQQEEGKREKESDREKLQKVCICIISSLKRVQGRNNKREKAIICQHSVEPSPYVCKFSLQAIQWLSTAMLRSMFSPLWFMWASDILHLIYP